MSIVAFHLLTIDKILLVERILNGAALVLFPHILNTHSDGVILTSSRQYFQLFPRCWVLFSLSESSPIVFSVTTCI